MELSDIIAARKMHFLIQQEGQKKSFSSVYKQEQQTESMISSRKSCSEVHFFFLMQRNCGCGQYKVALSRFCLCRRSRFYQRKSIGWYLQRLTYCSFELIVLLMGLSLPVHVLDQNKSEL